MSDTTRSGGLWLPFEQGDPVRQFATIMFIRGGLIAIVVTLVGGILGALYSIPALAPAFQSVGMDLRQLRPIHTAFASAWIFLGGVAVVHRWLQDYGGKATSGDRWRLRVQVLSWAVAGLGILVTLALGIGSGREYVGFHPAFSALILLGWLCYLWTFFRIAGPGFFERPLYVTMWGVGMLFFVVTFVEQHLYLLPGIFESPLQDLQVQWKATGTLVGSFNLFVYGAVIYIGERISRDPTYGHSKVAYGLFSVGLLNSFTNFAHHTYHLPQDHLVKWISFVVSMMEISILCRATYDLWVLVRKSEAREFCAARGSFAASKYWSVFILLSAILISIPPLNAIIHGTYAVTGHAMGATIGIDTMVLVGAIIWILGEHIAGREGPGGSLVLHTSGMRRIVVGLNLSVAALVGWLHVSGVITGVSRAGFGPDEVYVGPTWLSAWNGVAFSATGFVALLFFAALLIKLLPIAFRYWWVAEARA
ncbi:MAG: cbb3-type cytochrome c oxidase subunit I [Gemmatimonadetes bacterium]|nr:cbb3-type cytochrome c oxidase subunit I [Gemmatimonadota bacterium]MDA1103686.1 cbb3-type cytochrome c oxidase subunit I [Gemmatimonadota bacterium]